MIKILDGFSAKISQLDDYIEIYSYERVNIQTGKQVQLKLPYFRDLEEGDKYLNFELDKKLVLQNISCKWTNLNLSDSSTCIEMILKNESIESSSDRSDLRTIIGSQKNVDIRPNTLLGKIYLK